MSANRTQIITGRVLRNLKRHSFNNGDVQDEEIWGEINAGVDRINSDSNPDIEITITLKEDQQTYPLTTDAVTDPTLETYDNNIASIKVIEQPDSFVYPFLIMSNKEFQDLIDGRNIDWFGICNALGSVDFSTYIMTGVVMQGTKNGVNNIFYIPEDITPDSEEVFLNGVLQVRDENYTIVNSRVTMITWIPIAEDTMICNYIKSSAFGNSVVNTKQPLIGTIIKKRLKVYPVPDANYDGLEIDLMVYLKSRRITANNTTNPEPDKEWDKFLEFFATAQFLSAKEREQYELLCEREMKRLRPIEQRKHHTLARPKVM